MALELVKSEQFGTVQADIYSDGDSVFMTIDQLARCLEYSNGRKGIENLLERNDYLKESTYSTTLELRGVEGNREVIRNRRLFTEDGVYEVTMLSKQPKAREFRAWIREVLKRIKKHEMYAIDEIIDNLEIEEDKPIITYKWVKI